MFPGCRYAGSGRHGIPGAGAVRTPQLRAGFPYAADYREYRAGGHPETGNASGSADCRGHSAVFRAAPARGGNGGSVSDGGIVPGWQNHAGAGGSSHDPDAEAEGVFPGHCAPEECRGSGSGSGNTHLWRGSSGTGRRPLPAGEDDGTSGGNYRGGTAAPGCRTDGVGRDAAGFSGCAGAGGGETGGHDRSCWRSQSADDGKPCHRKEHDRRADSVDSSGHELRGNSGNHHDLVRSGAAPGRPAVDAAPAVSEAPSADQCGGTDRRRGSGSAGGDHPGQRRCPVPG